MSHHYSTVSSLLFCAIVCTIFGGTTLAAMLFELALSSAQPAGVYTICTV